VPRYRSAAEPALVVLAAVAVVTLASRPRRRPGSINPQPAERVPVAGAR
jgi:hypothetical protein